MLPFLSSKAELRGGQSTARPVSSMEPSEYEPGMQLNPTTFPGALFQLKVVNAKKPLLAISSSQILEVIEKPQRNGAALCDIVGIHQMSSLAKVQVHPGNSIVFQFQSGLTKSYQTAEATSCCEYLKKQMKSSGLQATHWSPAIEQQVSTGYELLETVRLLEERFSLDPSLEVLEAVMTLTREAVECLGEAQDERHLKALHRMQTFLTRADVIKLLDGVDTTTQRSNPSAGDELDYSLSGSGKVENERTLPVVTAYGFTSVTKDKQTQIGDDDENIQLEKELYDLINRLDDELKSFS